MICQSSVKHLSKVHRRAGRCEIEFYHDPHLRYTPLTQTCLKAPRRAPNGAGPKVLSIGGAGSASRITSSRLLRRQGGRDMATWTPDPTFYPSPRMAMKAPAETLAYVASFDPRRQVPDGIAVVDVDPK
jgi:56kDa selenium binding protein (SBP56)